MTKDLFEWLSSVQMFLLFYVTLDELNSNYDATLLPPHFAPTVTTILKKTKRLLTTKKKI